MLEVQGQAATYGMGSILHHNMAEEQKQKQACAEESQARGAGLTL
jgi:hypothetical protein